MQSTLRWFSAFCAITLLVGCARKEPIPPQKPPVIPQETVEVKEHKAPGSLYNGYDNLFSDAKAYNVGDIVTIKVFENLSGTGRTNTNTKRDNTMDLSFPTPTVLDKKVPKKNTIFGLNQKSSNSFKGQGDTTRSARLIATITARVVKTYPNGNLFIVGKKIVKINDDMQVLKISGIINPVYIASDNSIDSSKISDMYVEYNGEGFMTQAQRPGWLANFLMKIWPF